MGPGATRGGGRLPEGVGLGRARCRQRHINGIPLESVIVLSFSGEKTACVESLCKPTWLECT